MEKSSDNKSSSSEIVESRLLRLINSGDSVDSALLKSALADKEITESQYIALANKLFEKYELVEEGLANVGKKLEARVEELGIDPVTKLFKHDLLEQKLSFLVKELNLEDKRRHSPLCAVMIMAIDLDNLRIWNIHGHSVGDKALRIVADSLKEATRANDCVFRLGDKSDEIVVVMRIEKDLNSDELEKIFKNVQGVANSKYVEVGDEKVPVTVAMGYVVLKPGESRGNKEILNAADVNQTADKEPEVKIQRIMKAKADLKKLN